MKYHSELGVLVPERPADELFIGADRRDSINRRRCIPAPLGCGMDAREFRNLLSWQEHKISGLCQKCQDRVFGGSEIDRDAPTSARRPAPTEENYDWDYDGEEADRA